MNVLIACEYSGTVRDAFIAAGHNAMSCDLLPTERLGPHYQCGVLDVIGDLHSLQGFKMIEIFKILEDFPAYRISNLGRLQSRWQKISCYSGYPSEIKDRWVDVMAGENQKGYLQAVLCDGAGNKKTTRIHNLVAKYFIGDKPQGFVVRHLDSNPRNNKVSNLSYGTYAENENDKVLNGTWNTRNGGAKLTPSQVIAIREKIVLGESQKELALQYGVSRPTITRIANNTVWR